MRPVRGRDGTIEHGTGEDARPWWHVAVAAAVVVVLAGWMVRTVRRGTPTQHADYWQMTKGLFGGTWPDLGEVFRWQNEHPVVIAKLLFWLNGHLFDGSNITLGYLTVAIVVATVALLAAGTRRSIPGTAWISVTAATAALLLSRAGAWNFMKAMSGTAWLTANLFVVLALVLRASGRRWAAVAAAGVGTLCYATGLAGWPAVLVVGLAIDRKPKRELPTVIGACVAYAWYLWGLSGIEGEDRSTNLVDSARALARLTGSLFVSSASRAELLGALGIALGVALAVLALRRSSADAALGVGLFVFAVAAMGLIAQGRPTSGVATFVDSRYASLPALLWSSVLLLFAAAVPIRAAVHGFAALLAVPALLTGGGAVNDMVDLNPGQQLLAVAQRIDVADDSNLWTIFFTYPRTTDDLRGVGHYPFDDRFRLDCGLTGKVLPRTLGGQRVVELGKRAGEGPGRVLRQRPAPGVPRANEIIGTLKNPNEVRCILVTDADRRVIGAGVAGYMNVLRGVDIGAPLGRTFTALAPKGAEPYRTFVVPRG